MSWRGFDHVAHLRLHLAGHRQPETSALRLLPMARVLHQRSRALNADRVKLCGLTPRQRQVLLAIVEGRNTKETALLIGLTKKCIEYHRGVILRKLGLWDCGRNPVVQAVKFAIRVKLIEP